MGEDGGQVRRLSAVTINPKPKNRIQIAIGSTPNAGRSEREVIMKSTDSFEVFTNNEPEGTPANYSAFSSPDISQKLQQQQQAFSSYQEPMLLRSSHFGPQKLEDELNEEEKKSEKAIMSAASDHPRDGTKVA